MRRLRLYEIQPSPQPEVGLRLLASYRTWRGTVTQAVKPLSSGKAVLSSPAMTLVIPDPDEAPPSPPRDGPLPVLTIRNSVLFPHVAISIAIDRPASVAAVDAPGVSVRAHAEFVGESPRQLRSGPLPLLPCDTLAAVST